MSESIETVVDEVAPGQFAEAAPAAEAAPTEQAQAQVEGPKEGDAVLVSAEAGKPNVKVKWFKAENTLFRRPGGESGPVQWLCADEGSLEAAGNDPYAVKYAGVAIFRAPRVIDIPDLTAEEKAAAEAAAQPVAQA